ncbi:hypothetical protein FRC0103_01074 [Corynebacterium diphtheriae]|nr:hypothetical protein FRC0103_01074 [Corynebacterium diphtheriae]
MGKDVALERIVNLTFAFCEPKPKADTIFQLTG